LHTYFFQLVVAESEKRSNDVIIVCTKIRCELGYKLAIHRPSPRGGGIRDLRKLFKIYQ